MSDQPLLLWGDIHNHNEIGYAQGSLERSYEIAESHLDFYSFTPHGQNTNGESVTTYPVVDEAWPQVQQLARERNQPGVFTTFLGYEWHSGPWGHVHVVYGDDDQPLQTAPTLERLQYHMRGRNVMLIPHHTGYRNGVAWDHFDAELNPVVEIYSEHGCSERDHGLHPMVGHSGGPGDYTYTVEHGLFLGHRFGFTAGTDNHDGYPGGYGLGLTGVWAASNNRADILAALRNRNCYGVTGDRIQVEFVCGTAPMGSVVPQSKGTDLGFSVRAWDTIQLVELVRDGVPVAAHVPDFTGTTARTAVLPTGRYRLRLEYGWGPMKGYGIYDWEGHIRIDGGILRQVMPCFTSDPFDEHRRKRIDKVTDIECHWHSHTSRGGWISTRNGTPYCSANDALCLEVEGSPDTQIRLELSNRTRTSLVSTQPDWTLTPRPGHKEMILTIGDLLEGRRGFTMDGTPNSVVWHRALPESLYTLHGDHALRPDDDASSYYLRVTQSNGQMAWSSPIWIEG
ncbi:MAG: DUF3604 domain-containing protein [Candidatus Latescibacterota bacterium]|nr:DUF3604 domain-containing protein [Candidatus Latescibacterota bacterium]